jgi:ribosomal subunit interface protein
MNPPLSEAGIETASFPVQVTFRDLQPTPAMDAAVHKRAAALGRYFPRVLECRVVIQAPSRNRRKGKLYHVALDIKVPGKELMVNRNPEAHESHQDFYVAVRDAFDAARRELMDEARRRRMQIKSNVGASAGRVTRLFPEGYGYLETADGREIYFHRNSVLDGFERLVPGDEVRFSEEMGHEGPQASTVIPAGKTSRPAERPRP